MEQFKLLSADEEKHPGQTVYVPVCFEIVVLQFLSISCPCQHEQGMIFIEIVMHFRYLDF